MAQELRFTNYFFYGGRERRKGEKLSAILSTDMQTIDPGTLHQNVDLMTKPAELHKPFLQYHQVSKVTSLLLLSGVPEGSLQSGMPFDANQHSLYCL